jgi:hypothetical protein
MRPRMCRMVGLQGRQVLSLRYGCATVALLPLRLCPLVGVQQHPYIGIQVGVYDRRHLLPLLVGKGWAQPKALEDRLGQGREAAWGLRAGVPARAGLIASIGVGTSIRAAPTMVGVSSLFLRGNGSASVPHPCMDAPPLFDTDVLMATSPRDFNVRWTPSDLVERREAVSAFWR